MSYLGVSFVTCYDLSSGRDMVYTISRVKDGRYGLTWDGVDRPLRYSHTDLEDRFETGTWLVVGPPCAACEKPSYQQFGTELDYLCSECRAA